MPEETKYTDSALSDKIKEFLQRFKDNNDGRYVYVDKIDSMMPKNQTYITVDYIEFTTYTKLEKKFREDLDSILEAFARAIKEVLQTRFPDYVDSIKDEISIRITNYPGKFTVRQINSKNTGCLSIKSPTIKTTSISLSFIIFTTH